MIIGISFFFTLFTLYEFSFFFFFSFIACPDGRDNLGTVVDAPRPQGRGRSCSPRSVDTSPRGLGAKFRGVVPRTHGHGHGRPPDRGGDFFYF